MTASIRIHSSINPYRDNVQGKANEPITVAALLGRAEQELPVPSLGHTLETIYDRLESNAPRIAIIGGSWDHPAHIVDKDTVLAAAACIWRQGGVPFYFSVPVLCDGTAQSTMGMCYSLHSRNLVAQDVINQMEAHIYHGAFVVSGCDKTPLGIAAGLALLDRTRQMRGEAPVWAAFCPAHVLRGGTLSTGLVQALTRVAERARQQGYTEIAQDLEGTMRYILQCITNAAFQGVLERAYQAGLVTAAEHKAYEKQLAVLTCHAQGGICAFNGTGNSVRHVVSALGLAHPAVELLTEPPTLAQIALVVNDLFSFLNNSAFSVSQIIRANWANAVRVHSTTGGSTNVMMHLPAAMLYAGADVSIWDMQAIRSNPPIPDLFDYSLTEERDIFAFAKQCVQGRIRGIETIFYELLQYQVPVDLDAPTVTGTTWRDRLANTKSLPASGVQDNPVVLSSPRRGFSGIDVLQSNFFDSAVVKLSGMTDAQIAECDDQVYLVLFFENESDANRELLDVNILQKLGQHPAVSRDKLVALATYNAQVRQLPHLQDAELDQAALLQTKSTFLQTIIEKQLLRILIVISGQGPEAFGMPEMFTPMQHINSNLVLREMTALISDGRYSGTSYGAAIGHVTPEAFNHGRLGLLETGDLVHMRLRKRRIDLIDPIALVDGSLQPWGIDLESTRRALAQERHTRMQGRRKQIVITNQMRDVTDASSGVIPVCVKQLAAS